MHENKPNLPRRNGIHIKYKFPMLCGAQEKGGGSFHQKQTITCNVNKAPLKVARHPSSSSAAHVALCITTMMLVWSSIIFGLCRCNSCRAPPYTSTFPHWISPMGKTSISRRTRLRRDRRGAKKKAFVWPSSPHPHPHFRTRQSCTSENHAVPQVMNDGQGRGGLFSTSTDCARIVHNLS